MAEESVEEQNRRKLEAHLAKLTGKGGAAAAADRGTAEADAPPKREVPKPPPVPPGWQAWKKAHGGRVQSVRIVDAQAAADAADYKLLGVEKGASKEEIRRAFNRLAQEYHPDHGGDAEIFQAMQAAYKRLSK